ncbi:MAG: type II toxin-antitoxin system YafQ family toxin [Chloroflexi bacterium]|nr:type II toxin-antitoxin system YafQ family toxin [Chloroflexota bacterium]
MKQVSQTRQFARDVKRMRKRGKNLNKLKAIVTKLTKGEPLDPRYRDHPLSNNWQNSRDCHIEPDWILIYTIEDDYLRLERTGTHSDLFG